MLIDRLVCPDRGGERVRQLLLRWELFIVKLLFPDAVEDEDPIGNGVPPMVTNDWNDEDKLSVLTAVVPLRVARLVLFLLIMKPAVAVLWDKFGSENDLLRSCSSSDASILL